MFPRPHFKLVLVTTSLWLCLLATNAPAFFMTSMDTMLRPYLGKFIVVFLDDILVYSKTRKEHIEHLRSVFELLQNHLLFAKESKCVFFTKEIQYLGHIIFAKGMRVDPEKEDAILKWPTPKNLQKLQIFLGMLGFYRQYI